MQIFPLEVIISCMVKTENLILGKEFFLLLDVAPMVFFGIEVFGSVVIT